MAMGLDNDEMDELPIKLDVKPNNSDSDDEDKEYKPYGTRLFFQLLVICCHFHDE